MNAQEPLPPPAFFMKRILAYRPLPQVASGLCWVLFHSWPLFPGLLAKAFFDALQGNAPAGLTPAGIAALIVALALVRVGFVLFEAWIGTMIHFQIQGLLQRNLLERILERPGARALPGSVGEALSILRDDVETMWGGGWAFDVVGFTVFALGGIAILLSIDVAITLLVFLPIAAVIGLAHTLRARLRSLREQSREAEARMTGGLGEVLASVQAIQVAGAEDRVVSHIRRLAQERRRAVLHDRLLEISLQSVLAYTANLGAGLTLLAAASRMRAGTFSVGDFALFATYLMQVMGMTDFLGWIIAEYQQMGVAFCRATALLQGAPARRLVEHHPVPLSGPSPQPQIPDQEADDPLDTMEVSGLTLRYPESGRGVEDVSFRLDRGSLTVIAGRVGSGKTTLLRACLGLLEPEAGTIYWNGKQVADPARFFRPPRAAYTPQVPTLLSGTIRDNILLGLPNNGNVEKAIHNAVLEEDLAGFGHGLETRVGARGVRLSGGQIQRTAAARMFVRRPQLLVMDDLSSALDVETEQKLWQRLVASGATCLAVSHRPAVLEQADQILVLEEGRITARGPLARLLHTSAEMRLLLSGRDTTVTFAAERGASNGCARHFRGE